MKLCREELHEFLNGVILVLNNDTHFIFINDSLVLFGKNDRK